MEKFAQRWTPDQARLATSQFETGSIASMPFGVTEEGLVDFRGLPVPKPLILRQVKLSGIDVSFASFAKLILIGCEFEKLKLDGASGAVLFNATHLEGLSCSGARLVDSGSIGGTSCSDASFAKCDLSGGIFKDTRFVRCDFTGARLDDVDFGSSTIDHSHFDGKIKQCFFRGLVTNCNFQNASFIDSAFYGAEFVDCAFSAETLHVLDLGQMLERTRENAATPSLSALGKKSLEKWQAVFLEISPSVKHWLIDKHSLVRTDGREVGEELFKYFAQIVH